MVREKQKGKCFPSLQNDPILGKLQQGFVWKHGKAEFQHNMMITDFVLGDVWSNRENLMTLQFTRLTGVIEKP